MESVSGVLELLGFKTGVVPWVLPEAHGCSLKVKVGQSISQPGLIKYNLTFGFTLQR